MKDITNSCKLLQNSQTFGWNFFSVMVETWKKLKISNVFLLFIVCLNRNRSAIVRDLLSYNSLFVGQLYEDKSLKLRACDLTFTIDLQTVKYYSTNLCQS